MRPKCIVLDEPTAMLDPQRAERSAGGSAPAEPEEKVTVVLITHYMEEVIHADHVYVMG